MATATITPAPAWPGNTFFSRTLGVRTPSATAEDLSQELLVLGASTSGYRWSQAWMACQYAGGQMSRAGDGRLAAILRRAASGPRC